MPTLREGAAVCSVENDIYMIGGREEASLVDTVLKLSRTWEILSWKAPWRLEGMGLFYTENSLILFGGVGKMIANKKYCVMDLQGKELRKGELPVGGNFNGKTVTFSEGIYSVMVSDSQILEYQTCFKLVVVG